MPSSSLPRIVIFGATGRVGQLLVRAFQEKAHPVAGVGRRAGVLAELGCDPVVVDLSAANDHAPVAHRGDIVINAVHARFTQAIAGLCDRDISRIVVIGSTRYLTRFPDRKAQEVIAAAQYLEAGKLPWVLLHPTMIYGAQGENNVQRMAALIHRFHVIPLPDGGSALIQPIHVGDVVSSVVSAALKPGLDRRTIHIGGPEPMPYHAFIRAIANAAKTWVKVVSLPLPLLQLVAAITRLAPGMPGVSGAEVQRLLEDKAVDSSEMKRLLEVSPRTLEQGLAETFHPQDAELIRSL